MTEASKKERRDCQFPIDWTGSWFQSGVRETVVIRRNSISIESKLDGGNCTHSHRDKFVIKHYTFTGNRGDCYTCLAITEKHSNVLQYKMSECVNRKSSLKDICGRITGDAPLYTMFRVGGDTVPCPFVGPFEFSYDNAYGECSDPASHMDVCTDETKLKLSYQACADILLSEHKNVQLECTATWQEGSSNYLVGRFSHKSIMSDEESYRCFVYEATPEGFNVAQSADATCNGLYTATGGPVSMHLRKDSYPSAMCSFPLWMTSVKKWRPLQDHYKFVIDATGGIISKINNHHKIMHTDRCIDIKSQSDNMTTFVTFTIEGCRHGYKCFKVHRRNEQIIEIQYGNIADSASAACKVDKFDDGEAFETLVHASSLREESCPQGGRYKIIETTTSEICSNRKSTANFGCDDPNKITVSHICEANNINDVALQIVKEIYNCHGHWAEDGVQYLIASDKNEATSCMVFSKEDGVIRISNHLTSCERTPSKYLNRVTEFSITSIGQCHSSSANLSLRTSQIARHAMIVFTLFFLLHL